MQKREKIYIGIIFILVLFMSILISGGKETKNNIFTTIDVDRYFELLKSEDISYVYIGRPTCSHCQEFEPVLSEFTDRYDIKIYYLNIDEIASSDFNRLNENLTKVMEEEWQGSTPTLVSIGEGSVQKFMLGYDSQSGEEGLASYFDVVIEERPDLKSITIAEYSDIMSDKTNNIIMIGRPTCGYCVKIIPLLEQIQYEREIVIHYLDVDKLDSNGWKILRASYKPFEELATPYIIITSGNKVIDESIGYKSIRELNTFFAKNGF